jgi:hypothetical protein
MNSVAIALTYPGKTLSFRYVFKRDAAESATVVLRQDG